MTKTMALILLAISSTAQHKMVNKSPANKGEQLEFKLSYGWFTIGRASMKTAPYYEKRDGFDCYKVDITGKTAGLAGVFSKVNDKWGAIVRKDNFLPYYSYRNIEEGNYRKNEKVYFEYRTKRIRIEDFDVKANKPRPTTYLNIKKDCVFDMIGGLMYARSIDYGRMHRGDTIQINAYFDKKFYDFKVIYQGIEKANTKIGKIYCYKLSPIMPHNKLFRGDNPVIFWLSADANRLPLRVEAKMFFGTAYCELTSYKNVKNGVNSN